MFIWCEGSREKCALGSFVDFWLYIYIVWLFTWLPDLKFLSRLIFLYVLPYLPVCLRRVLLHFQAGGLEVVRGNQTWA